MNFEDFLAEAKTKLVPTHIVHVDRGGQNIKDHHQIFVAHKAGDDNHVRQQVHANYSHSHPAHKVTKIEKYDPKNPAHKHYVANHNW